MSIAQLFDLNFALYIVCKYYPLLGKLLYGRNVLIFDQPFIAQLILPNIKEKTVKIIQLYWVTGCQPDLTSTVGKYIVCPTIV